MRSLENVLKTSSKCLEDLLRICLEDIFARHFEDVWRRLEDEDDSKTSWRRLEDVFKTFLQGVLETSLRHFENVLKTYDQDKYIGLDQDVEKTLKELHMGKANIFVLIKMPWRRLLKTKTKGVFKTSSRHIHQDE